MSGGDAVCKSLRLELSDTRALDGLDMLDAAFHRSSAFPFLSLFVSIQAVRRMDMWAPGRRHKHYVFARWDSVLNHLASIVRAVVVAIEQRRLERLARVEARVPRAGAPIRSELAPAAAARPPLRVGARDPRAAAAVATAAAVGGGAAGEVVELCSQSAHLLHHARHSYAIGRRGEERGAHVAHRGTYCGQGLYC